MKVHKSLFLYAVSLMFASFLFSACENSTSAREKTALCNDIKNQYLVIFKERWQNVRSSQVAGEVRAFTNQFLKDYKISKDSIISYFDYTLRGFSARIDSVKVKSLQADSRVKYVEQNQCFHAL